ncbi:MAG: hypothetical protein ACRDLR_06140, partial [Gaiellaceae bacterium]
RQNWLDLPGRGPEERELLEQALATTDASQLSAAVAAEAIEPLLWLLDELAQGVKLTHTGALPRALVRAAVERYPDWWDTQTVGHPYPRSRALPARRPPRPNRRAQTRAPGSARSSSSARKADRFVPTRNDF